MQRSVSTRLCRYLIYNIHMHLHMHIYYISTQWLLYMEQRELGTQFLFQIWEKTYCAVDMGTGAKHLCYWTQARGLLMERHTFQG